MFPAWPPINSSNGEPAKVLCGGKKFHESDRTGAARRLRSGGFDASDGARGVDLLHPLQRVLHSARGAAHCLPLYRDSGTTQYLRPRQLRLVAAWQREKPIAFEAATTRLWGVGWHQSGATYLHSADARPSDTP